MERKCMIFTIIVLSVFLSGHLAAEEIVGRSIFPNIETPHPYPGAVKGNTLVWSETIHKPGAAWIKIHFSKFRLNNGDYVLLVDMNGGIIERIKGKDVASKRRSKFNVKNSGNKTVAFWGPAVDGNKITVELHRTSNKKNDLGFIIDEVGIGGEPISDKGVGPIYNTEGEKKMIDKPLCDDRPQIIRLGPGKNDVDVLNNPLGKMLYRKGVTWYTGEGSLKGVTGNHFLPGDAGIDSRDVLETFEVRFFIEYTTRENVSTLPGHYTYYAYYSDRTSIGGSKSGTGGTEYITLRNDDKMVYIEPSGRGPDKKIKLPKLFVTSDCYWGAETVNDQSTIDTWEQNNIEPSLDETVVVPPPEDNVLDINCYVSDEYDNWYNVTASMNTSGELALANISQDSSFSCSQSASAAGISHPSHYYPWYPSCCGLQYLFCKIFKRVFWWRYLNCETKYFQCVYYEYYHYYYYYLYGYYNPCYWFGKWGMTGLLYVWFYPFWY